MYGDVFRNLFLVFTFISFFKSLCGRYTGHLFGEIIANEQCNFHLPLSLYSRLFILEQTKEHRFGVLLEISDKVNTKLNVFSYVILQCWLNILEHFVTILNYFEKHSVRVVLLEMSYFVHYLFKVEV